MKKALWVILLMLLIAVFSLSACEEDFTIVDTEDMPMMDTADSMATDTNVNGIIFNTLAVEGNSAHGEVANIITNFSFLDEIEVCGEAAYTVSLDIQGMNVVPTKIVALHPGDNIFYIIESLGDHSKVHTVTIRRRPVYNVVFETNGGTIVEAQTIEEGKHAIVPDNPIKEGYTFISWDYEFENPVTSDIIIKSLWNADKYKITYEANGGYVNNSEQTVSYNASYVLEIPTRTGYTFVGWYDGETEYYSGTWKTLGNITLKARWIADTYDISYVNDGGEHSNPITYTVEDEVNLVAPTKKGYTFIGWTSDGQTEPVINTKISRGSTGNKKYTANWSVNTYEITYDASGGFVNNDRQTVSYNALYVLESPTRSGYTFEGWYDGETEYYGGTWKTLSNIILTARWSINSYYVYVNSSSGGSATGTGWYEYGTDVIVVAKSKLGYIWLGWYDENGNIVSTEQSYSFTVGDNSTILNAKWKISDAMSDFKFSSTETTCTINDVVDDSKSTYIIPEYVTNIGDWAFFMCDYLTSISIPYGVTSIGDHAFSGCQNLASITLPNSVTYIGRDAFSNCDGLTSVVIPESVTRISEYMFNSCSNLTSVVFHDEVAFIGKNAFSGCTKLTDITFNGQISKWNIITLGDNWNFMVPSEKIKCSDGIVILS